MRARPERPKIKQISPKTEFGNRQTHLMSAPEPSSVCVPGKRGQYNNKFHRTASSAMAKTPTELQTGLSKELNINKQLT